MQYILPFVVFELIGEVLLKFILILEKRLSSFDMYQRDSGTSGFDWITLGY